MRTMAKKERKWNDQKFVPSTTYQLYKKIEISKDGVQLHEETFEIIYPQKHLTRKVNMFNEMQ